MKGHNILIVSPRTHFREHLRNILISEGYTVRTAIDALEALDIIRYSGLDLIVTDLVLPRMDGIELVANAKDLQQHVRTVVFFPDCPKEREEMLRKMGVQWVGHPETPEQAKQWIKQALKDGAHGSIVNRAHGELRSVGTSDPP